MSSEINNQYDSIGRVTADESQAVDSPTRCKKNKKLNRYKLWKKTKAIVSRCTSVCLCLIGACLLFLCMSNLYQQLFNPYGYTGFFDIGEAVVTSKSMEPELYQNDLIFYKAIDPEDVAIGDTIIYQKTNSLNENILIVHKIEQIDNGYFIAKGVNNAVADDVMPDSAIIGKYIFKISNAGVIFSALSTTWALVIIIITLIGLFALRIFIYYFQKKKNIEEISPNKDTRDAINCFFEM
jgi:signal peptidase I